MPLPTIPETITYLRLDPDKPADVSLVTRVWAAEGAAQSRVCRIPDPYPPDLAAALLRRVAHSIAAENVPLGVQAGDEGGLRLSANDPEVRRLEAPFRRKSFG